MNKAAKKITGVLLAGALGAAALAGCNTPMDGTQPLLTSGLEARVPFADHRIIEYVWNVPWSMKCRGIHKVQLDSVFCCFLRREQRSGSVQTFLIQICHHDHGRTDISVKGIGQSSQAHRTGPCHNCHFSPFFDSHLMSIDSHLRMVSRIKGTDAAGHWLCQGRFIISPSLVL